MKFKHQLFLLSIFIWAGLCLADVPKVVLDLKLSEPSTIDIKDKKYELVGNYKDGALALGNSNGISLPAESLFGEIGSLALDFKYKDSTKTELKNRPFITLRGKDRLYIGAYFIGNSRVCRFAFKSFIESNSLGTLTPLKPDTWYRLLITWDGDKFKFYLDGNLQGEEKQSIKAEFPQYAKLNFGPYKDGWIAGAPWGEDDCFIKNLKVWDGPLSAVDVLTDSGKKIELVSSKYPTFLQIPKVDIPPVIDGKITEESWNKASSFITLNDIRKPFASLSYQDNRPLICHDGKNLYFAFQTIFPVGAELLSGSKRTDKDIEVWGDESYEIYLYLQDRLYRFAGNAAGGYCESLNSDDNFNGKWIYSSNCSFRIDNRWVWQAEVAIPFDTIGIKDIDEEPQIKLNFCRTWRCFPETGVTMLGTAGGYKDIKHFASIKLSNSTITTQTQKLIDPNFGNFENIQSFYSAANNDLHYQVKLLDDIGAVPEYLLVDSKISFKDEKNSIKTFQNKITKSSFNQMLFNLKDDKGNLILQQLVPFMLSRDYIEITPVFSQSKILLNARYSILHGKFPKENFFSLLLSPDGKILTKEKISSDKTFEIKFDSANLKGEYTIQVVNSKEEILDQKKISYLGIAEWESLDETSKVISPFTPLQIKETPGQLDVAMWNRRYIFNHSVQPSQIQSGTSQLLSGPAQLEINSKPLKVEQFKTSKSTPAHIAYEVSGDNSDYSFKQESFIEYDGIIFNKLTINAKKDLANIRLVIPLDSKYSKFIHATKSGFGGGGRKNIAVTKDIELEYYPSVWIGDQEKGLAFFAESDRTWLGGKLPIQIKHSPESNTLIVTFADKLITGKEINVEFGLMATPVRPLPENYPLNTFGGSYPIHLNQAPPKAPVTYANVDSWEGAGFFDLPLDGKGESTSEWLKKHLEKSNKYNSIFTPYMTAMFFPEEYVEAKTNILEWQKTPANHLKYERNGKKLDWYWTCAKSNGRKFFIYKFAQLLKRQALRGVYFDFGIPAYCNNQLHGCEGGYPIMAQRKFYQGIARSFVEAGVKDYVIVIHNSESVQFPTCTHATHFFNGEGLRQMSSSTFHDGKDLQDTYTLLDFATEHSSLPFGITSSVYVPADTLLPRFGGGKEDPQLYSFRMTKAALAGTLPHNTISSLHRMHYGLYDKVVRFYDDFGVNNAEFLPYWRNHEFVTVLKGKDIYVSVYRSSKANEVLAVISHVAKEHLSQDVEVEFSPKAFGFKSFSNAEELFTSPDPEYDRLYKEKNILRIPIKLGDFGIEFKGLENNKVKLHLDFHSVAIVKLKGAL